jgi:transcriptional regulator with XRE-family HTH domain
MTFGERLKRLRELAGLSQAELARRSRLNRANINMLESGARTGLTVESARRLARALNVTLDYLVGDSVFGDPDAEEDESSLSVSRI